MDLPTTPVEAGPARPPAAVTAWHVPEDRLNPYQRLLRESLARCGVTVRFQPDPHKACALAVESGEVSQVLHLHWLPRARFGPQNLIELALYGLAVRRFRRTGGAVVFTVHNLYSHEAINRGRERRLRRYLIRQCHGVIVHSPRAEELVRREFRVAPGKPFAVIPHGHLIGYYPGAISRAEARQRLGLLPDQRVVAFAGNIRRYKGVPDLVRAFRSVDSPSARLVIAGRPFDDRVDRAVAALVGEDRRIIFRPGLIKDDEFQVYLGAADIIALPYLNILTSGAAILAMSFGKACIAPPSGCLVDVLSQQPELFFNPAEAGSLASVLVRALGDPELTDACGARNLKRVAGWTWEAVGRQTADFYASCLVAAGGERTTPVGRAPAAS